MGDKADDILMSFRLTEAPAKEYETVKGKFNRHFIKMRNIIFEREKFNKRKQQPGETSDSFITELYALAEYCEYGALQEEMIRDRLVVGLLDATLSEKLELDPDLTLEKAIAKVCNAETVKSQQAVVRGGDASNMDYPIGTIGK